jgi:hypothetical protein
MTMINAYPRDRFPNLLLYSILLSLLRHSDFDRNPVDGRETFEIMGNALVIAVQYEKNQEKRSQ